MKKLLFLALILNACAKAPSPSVTAVSLSGSNALSPFENTKAQSEEAILQLAAKALRAGIALDGPRAERCWRAEEDRPAVREICALLWAGRGEGSTEMEGALLSSRSRLMTLALLPRRDLIARISWAELLERIDALEKDPLWARADLANAWLEKRGSPGIGESEALLAKIRPPVGVGPRDLASALAAIRRLRPGAWQDFLNSYCDAAAAGESRLRCWRVLGAMNADEGRLAPMLPSLRDDDWILFNRSFPRFAEKLRAYLR